MKRNLSFRIVLAAALAAAALGATSAAQARPEASISIDLPGPPVFLRPPLPLPPAIVVREHGGRPEYRNDFERRQAWRHAEWERREWQRREWERREWQRREWERRHHDRGPWHGRGWD